MEIISKNLSDSEKFAEEFVAQLASPDGHRGASVVGLYGNLGSGKTTFVQSVARALGVKEYLTSPTFVIMKRFTIQDSRFKNLIHVDAYRLKSSAELEKLGFKELLKDPGNFILIEWADIVADILPPKHKKLNFEFIDATTRKIISE
ncbi:MAG: tRNA (adenosine(37)-N6)-threonylcarbamoyltransferase complex ATPase subunit type 1 TsaE [Patescibacteria group bacterium]